MGQRSGAGRGAGGHVRPDVVAAGAVVLRKGGDVLLVHRPKYDDWAFPKGKQDPGEHVTVTAVREVLEETGLQVRLGRPLPPQLYRLSGGRAKTVHFWVGRPAGNDDVTCYAVNEEIDDLGWFSRDKARKRLTYPDDRALLAQLDERPNRTRALVVLRHGDAVARSDWPGADEERPLTRRGTSQARLLVPVLAAYGVTRVVTSDSERCVASVTPYALFAGDPPQVHAGLNEETWTDRSVAAVLDDLLGSQQSAVLCTHRPVLPAVLEYLGVEEEALAKGECVVVHHRKGRVVATERHLVR